MPTSQERPTAVKTPNDSYKPYEMAVFEQVESKLHPVEIKLFKTLAARHRDSKPQIAEFDYPENEKKQDIETLRQRQTKAGQNTEIEKIHYVQTKIFEALLSEILELHWLPGAYVTETSDFDDWVNGVDAVLEMPASRSAIIDFTSQKDREKLAKKFETIFDRIKRGSLGQVKYFKSQIDNKQHQLKMLPIVIVGLSAKTLAELTELYLAGKKKELANHWVRYALAEELIAQIGLFQRYINNTFRQEYNAITAQTMHNAYEELKKDIMAFKQKISQGEKMDRIIKQKLETIDPVYNYLVAIANG